MHVIERKICRLINVVFHTVLTMLDLDGVADGCLLRLSDSSSNRQLLTLIAAGNNALFRTITPGSRDQISHVASANAKSTDVLLKISACCHLLSLALRDTDFDSVIQEKDYWAGVQLTNFFMKV
jgi:hypothetical protein